jgi:RNA polymerase sigma-70 factor (ECF subfamily)
MNDTSPEKLLAALAAVRPELPAGEHVGQLLCEVCAQARRAWPAVSVPIESFVAHLARHLPMAVDQALLDLRAADLYLAFACALGDATALSEFDLTFGSELRIVKARLRKGASDGDDLIQECRQKLFAPPRPKIAEYSGQGDLRHWLRVTLLRALIDHQRSNRQRIERERPHGEPLELPDMRDPALVHLKQQYREEFRAAFEDAARALNPEERVLLRHHFADGLTIDDLANLYRIHRATAARRIAKAREALLAGTKQRLMTKLRLSRDELDSVMRLIESNVHVSVKRVLA